MSKIIFTVKYRIKEDEIDEFLKISKDLKLLVKGEGLINYDIYRLKGKNEFCEIYEFENYEAYENYDDTGELLSALLKKLSTLIEEGSTEYSVFEKIIEA